MSTTDNADGSERPGRTRERAAAEVTFAYDDPGDPSIVTLYPEETDAHETTWISADADAAVGLAEVR